MAIFTMNTTQEMTQPNSQGIPQTFDNYLMVGDFPVLRVLPKDGNAAIKGANQQSTAPNDGHQGQFNPDFQNNKDPMVIERIQGSNLGNTHDNDDTSGWTLVERRKRRKNQIPTKDLWNNQQSKLQIHARKLKQQQRCFKCLLKGHIQAVCANPRRCLNCNKTGHIIRSCPLSMTRKPNVSQPKTPLYKKEESKPTKTIVSQRIPKKESPVKKPFQNPTQKPNSKTKPIMEMSRNPYNEAPANWLTMPMRSPAELWHRRPRSLNVYLAPREGLAPANRFLECAAFVFAGPRAADPMVKRRIANCMAREFRRDPREFPVYTIDEDFGDLLIIFPDAAMAEAATTHANFYIGNNINITLHPYSPELQMAFDPLCARVRIRVYGVPLQHWNRADMLTLVSGFGYPLRIAPYFINGNYEYLTMLIATSDSEEVPFHLQLKVNPFEKEVRVEMDGWLMNERPPPPNHRRGRANEGRGGQQRGLERGGPSHHGGARRRDNDRNRAHRDDMAISSSGSNRSRSAMEWMQDWIQNLKRALIEAGFLKETSQEEKPKEGLTQLQIVEYVPPKETSMPLIPSKLDLSFAGVKIMDESGMSLFKFHFLGPAAQITQQTIFSGIKYLFQVMAPNSYLKEKEMQAPGFKGLEKQEAKSPKVQITELMLTEGLETHSDEDSQGLPPGFEFPVYKKGSEEDSVDGPPPGFELPIYCPDLVAKEVKVGKKRGRYAQTNLKVRRSPRLEKKRKENNKNSGTGKKFKGEKKNKKDIVKLAYQESLNPLDMA